MEKLVWDFIKEQGLIQEGQNIGAAVSGGSDSMALLVCLCSLAGEYGFSVYCVHFEHGIRGEKSLADADFVAEYCDANRVPLFMGAADVPALAGKWGLSEETAAKRAREEYFASLIGSGELDAVATGHHRNDNAESVLMHILRGCSLSGLRGVHARHGGMIRPLLCVDKRRILRYADEKGIPYVLDESNAENGYRRNYVRNVLMPQIEEYINPDASAALNRLSELAGTDAAYLDSLARDAYASCAVKAEETVELSAERLAALPAAIAGRVVRLSVAALHSVEDVEYAHVKAVLRLARAGRTGARVNLSHNVCAQMEYGRLIFGFPGREKDYSFELRFDPDDKNVLPNGDYITARYVEERTLLQGGGYDECLDADKLPADLAIRTRHFGDVFRPLHGGEKKLKDYFIDKKLPRSERAKTPLLADGKNIVWAIGHTISDDYCVDENTRRIINLTYHRVREEKG